MGWNVTRIAIPQGMVMGALDYGNGVYLDVTKMLDCRECGSRSGARLFRGWQTLGMQNKLSSLID